MFVIKNNYKIKIMNNKINMKYSLDKMCRLQFLGKSLLGNKEVNYLQLLEEEGEYSEEAIALYEEQLALERLLEEFSEERKYQLMNK